MAKIKVHELAKELDKQSKDIISFLQEKGIEAKVAQSSIEEAAAEMVRREFGGSRVKEEAAAGKSGAAAEKAEAKAGNVETKAEKAEAKAGNAPEKAETKTGNAGTKAEKAEAKKGNSEVA